MGLSAQGASPEWVGKVLVDPRGAQIGACTGVLADDTPQWLAVDLGRTVWLPAAGAVELVDGVQVTVSQVDVATAPNAGDGPPSGEEKAALSRHYGVGPLKAKARRRRTQQVVLAGGFAGAGAVAAAVLARRQRGTPQPPEGRQALFRGTRGAVSAAAGMTPAAAAFVANLATRGARLAAAATRKGVHAGATLGRAGSAAARTAGLRAARVTAAARAGAAQVKDSGVRGGKSVGDSIGSVSEAVSQSSAQLQKRWRKAMGKITAVLALGVGYILGTRAGRERYDQLKQSAAKLVQQPQVQQVQALAGEKLAKGTGQGKQLSANARQRAMDVRAKVRPKPTNQPGLETGTDPYAMPGTGIPSAGPPPQVPAADPLTTARPDQGEPNT